MYYNINLHVSLWKWDFIIYLHLNSPSNWYNFLLSYFKVIFASYFNEEIIVKINAKLYMRNNEILN